MMNEHYVYHFIIIPDKWSGLSGGTILTPLFLTPIQFRK
jgi:hypothetical protein